MVNSHDMPYISIGLLICLITISGWWYTYPSEKYECQLGWWHSPYMENNPNVPNLARSQRRTQNVRSGTRVPNAGVFLVVLWIPEASESFFLLPAKRIHSSTWSFSRSFQAAQEQNLQALTCTVLLKPGKKRIRLWPAERFLKALKKGSVFGLPSAF